MNRTMNATKTASKPPAKMKRILFYLLMKLIRQMRKLKVFYFRH